MATQEEVLVKIEELRRLADSQGVNLEDQLRMLEQSLQPLPSAPPQFLAWENVQASRRQDRPKPQDFVEALIDGFIEFKGDRRYGDDKAILGGIGSFNGIPVTVIATRRGYSLQSNMEFNFGMPHPEGYRKALRLMEQAGKFKRPILVFVDTPGAYPGVQSEERGISEAIATNLYRMIGIPVPIITTITGEGGSGGALALSVADRLLMMENAIFSVISPEGCASILFKDSTQAPKAAQALKLDAKSLKELGLIDAIVREGQGMHIDKQTGWTALRALLAKELSILQGLDEKTLLDGRYRKFRTYGKVTENSLFSGK